MWLLAKTAVRARCRRRLDQRRILVLDVADSLVDWPDHHVLDRVGNEQRFQLFGICRLLAEPCRPCSGARMTGMRSCSSASSWFGEVVTIAKLRTLSPTGERHVSQSPASAINLRSASPTA